MSVLEPLETLQDRENELWDAIKGEVGSSTIDLISELIEVNIEIEKHCNQ